MNNNIIQLINDEIICYKKAIEDVEEKLNLLCFLNGVDDYMGKSFNLNREHLISQRQDLESKLKGLLDKKTALTGEESAKESISTGATSHNSLLISNYLSLQNFESVDNKNRHSGF